MSMSAEKEFCKRQVGDVTREFFNDCMSVLYDTLDDNIENLVATRLIEKVKEHDVEYVYDWFDSSIYERPELKDYSREQLPNIIRVTGVAIFGYNNTVIREMINKHKEENPGMEFIPPFHDMTQIRHHAKDFRCEVTHDIYWRNTNVYITLEGEYFYSEDIETIGMERILQTIKSKNLIPLPRKVYEKIICASNNFINYMFEYSGDVKNRIKIHWSLDHPMEAGLQLFQAQMNNKIADLKIKQAKAIIDDKSAHLINREKVYQQRMLDFIAKDADLVAREKILEFKESRLAMWPSTVNVEQEQNDTFIMEIYLDLLKNNGARETNNLEEGMTVTSLKQEWEDFNRRKFESLIFESPSDLESSATVAAVEVD